MREQKDELFVNLSEIPMEQKGVERKRSNAMLSPKANRQGQRLLTYQKLKKEEGNELSKHKKHSRKRSHILKDVNQDKNLKKNNNLWMNNLIEYVETKLTKHKEEAKAVWKAID
jgi:hypothetical protein